MNNSHNHESNRGSQAKHFAEPDSQRLVQKHMNDQQHEITDEEIRNVRISTDHINLDETQVLKHEREREETEDGNTERPIVTPWDVTT